MTHWERSQCDSLRHVVNHMTVIVLTVLQVAVSLLNAAPSPQKREPAMSDSLRYGYTFIWVDDVHAAVEWYEQALGLSRRVLRENGPLGWYAEMQTGNTTLAIADTREAGALFPDGFRALDEAEPALFQISFISNDVPADYQRALTAGGVSLAAPHDEPWGQTISRVRAPHGTVISIVSVPPTF